METKSENQISIAIADDHKIFRDGIKMALSGKRDLKVLWEAQDGREMLQKLAEHKPDVLLMDIRMPEIDGMSAIPIVRKDYEDLKIIILTMYEDQEMIWKMMDMGANAYLTKTTDPEEIYDAILTCMNDDFYFNELVNKAVVGKFMKQKIDAQHHIANETVHFNEKELKILQLLAEDKTTDEISKTIFLSPRTIETIRQHMKYKTNVKTIGGLIVYGIKHKLIH